ncbi:MAG: hypothetical protein GX941_04780, partial [Candidatus Methanofastidiosa archaeon]|nr:hypothetical protein [Candidatus Methanofastidiosa archaeon]
GGHPPVYLSMLTLLSLGLIYPETDEFLQELWSCIPQGWGMSSLYNKTEFPRMITRDGLGDYAKRYPDFYTETDIKTKIMVLASAPKGYNLDKMLEFLAEDNTVFMIYLVGIDYEKDYIKQATNPVISRFIACLSFNLSLVCRLNLLNDT